MGSSFCVNGARSDPVTQSECGYARPALQFFQDDTDAGRDRIVKGLCIYLNEDPGDLVQEFIDVEETISEGTMEKTTMGIIVLKNTSEDDVRIVLEGVTVIQDLDNVAFATAMLFGLIYALNLSYPQKLKCTFEIHSKKNSMNGNCNCERKKCSSVSLILF